MENSTDSHEPKKGAPAEALALSDKIRELHNNPFEIPSGPSDNDVEIEKLRLQFELERNEQELAKVAIERTAEATASDRSYDVRGQWMTFAALMSLMVLLGFAVWRESPMLENPWVTTGLFAGMTAALAAGLTFRRKTQEIAFNPNKVIKSRTEEKRDQ
ncbi:hypothetical protein ACFVWN_01035 [Nocardiopsis flavescens]|uniref:hypothetical protein n=1 Tax=Nocardiopsis flavescens TaxID=758803 RepID=UPI00365DE2A4